MYWELRSKIRSRALIPILRRAIAGRYGWLVLSALTFFKRFGIILAVSRSGLFDPKWYLASYSDVADSGIDPVRHYIDFGASEGRDPSPLFHTTHYQMRNPDVESSGFNPLVHYILYGEIEGRNPNPLFDVAWYYSRHSNLFERRESALLHYLEEGSFEGADPNPLFNSRWYLQTYAEVSSSGMNPLAHYLLQGASRGYRTTPFLLNNLQIWERKGAARSPTVAYKAEIARGRSDLISEIEKFRQIYQSRYFERLNSLVVACDETQLQHIDDCLSCLDSSRLDRMIEGSPLVSVIMAVRNREKLVADAIRSVLDQTYQNFELLICDDDSEDATREVCALFADPRVKLTRLKKRTGAAAARNACVGIAQGEYFAYLDSDNLWHPEFLGIMIAALRQSPGKLIAYANYFDTTISALGAVELRGIIGRPFDYELQLKNPFIDLNSIAHHRALYDTFGGFDDRLEALQDLHLVTKYAWARDALHVCRALNIYQRFEDVQRISDIESARISAIEVINNDLKHFYANGVRSTAPSWLKKVTVLSWDMTRNHFAKAHSVAEALSTHYQVKLISFRFSNAEIFRPLASERRSYELVALSGGKFPVFLETLCDAIEQMSGDVFYAIKPRLTSFGLSLLANCSTETPIFLEVNDLETLLEGKRIGKLHRTFRPEDIHTRLKEAANPQSLIWTQYLETLVTRLPTVFTHNENLNEHYGLKCLFMRNIKSEKVFNPSNFERPKIRKLLNLKDHEKMILFAGTVREHKGVNELVKFVMLHDNYKLFIVYSAETPELDRLRRNLPERVTLLSPRTPFDIASVNMAADAVVLWLDPREAVSHFQMPYKFTDAIAMGTPVIANSISDLSRLSNIVWTVPYADFDALDATLKRIFDNPLERQARSQSGRRLFQKEFTYHTVRQNIDLACNMTEIPSRYEVSEEFREMFFEFCERSGAQTHRIRSLVGRS